MRINLDCKTHFVDRNGEVPLLLRVAMNGEQGYFNTGKRIKKEYYDEENKSVRAGIKGGNKLSVTIAKHTTILNDIIDGFQHRGEVLTIHKLKEIYSQETGQVKSECFFKYVEKTIKWERENTEITSDTLDTYDAHLNKLKTYRNKLSIHDFTKTFLTEYRHYILNDLNQSKNTGYHAMCFLRKYTKKLFGEGRIKPYPFTTYTVGSPFEVEREYLDPEELSRLHDLYDSQVLTKIVRVSKSKYTKYKEFEIGKKYQEVLRYFLVSCYCGLRHSDIKTLCRNDIKGNYIIKEMQKGREGRKKTVRIPIRKRLFSLLDLNNPKGVLFENPVMEDSQTNKYLKAIMKEAKIEKHITFHCARHTFAIVSLLKGVSITVISDILGHSELTTTQRYAKVVDRLREQEMNKWDDPDDNKLEIICPDCGNSVLQFAKGIIALNRIPIVCPFCSANFSYILKDSLTVKTKDVVGVLSESSVDTNAAEFVALAQFAPTMKQPPHTNITNSKAQWAGNFLKN